MALECNPGATCEDLINGIVFWWANFESVVRNSECGFGKEILGEDGFFRLTLFVAPGGQQSALLYAANHAVSDQRSAQLVIDELLADVARRREEGGSSPSAFQRVSLPISFAGPFAALPLVYYTTISLQGTTTVSKME